MRLCFILFITLILGSSLSSPAQSLQQKKTEAVFQQVKRYFNSKQADSIYTLAGANFKKQLSLETFKYVADNQLFPLGEIKESSLVSFVNNKVGTYKLQFGSTTLQLLLSLDQEDKIELFLFQPYKDPVPDKQFPAVTSNPMISAIDKKIDSAARLYIQKANTVGLSIGIIKNGQEFHYNYGETARGNARLPTANSIFEIGSITKTFTATLLAYYVNEGRVKLTDPVTMYLPDSVANNKELKLVTLQTLSNHTSGLPRLPGNFDDHSSDPLNPYKDYTMAYLYSYLKNCKLSSKPGELYAYSNLAVGLLGTILEKVSGKTFEKMVEEIICTPLGMKGTAEHLSPSLQSRFVSVYNEDGKQTTPWDFDALAACGSLRSTVNDLVIYARANMIKGDTKLSKAFELTHQVTFDKDPTLGLGWHIIMVNDVPYYFHNGGTYGCSTFLAFNKQKNIAVVILANSGSSVDALGADIIKRIQ